MTGQNDDPDDDDRTRMAPLPPQYAPPPQPVQDPSVSDSALPTGWPGQSMLGPAHGGKLPIGTLINNNYRIEEVLKAGGMGEVYRGIEIGTGDPVAIKAILPEKAEDAEAGLLFKREAKTLRQLVDDTIVRYYNYVHDPALNRYFLVMEFIDGVPLKDHVAEEGALSLAETQTLLRRLAGGLSKAHAKKVIHRDLSPDNVMLPHRAVAEARLIDFGIAKSTMVTEGTMHGRFAGKFKYVAPEQLGHYGGHIGPATDIYGLALLTCAAVIGRPLDMGSSIAEAVQSRQSIPDLYEVPQELRPLLSWMLEPDPAARPSSMAEVQYLVDNPAEIPPQYLDGWQPPLPEPVTGTGTGAMTGSLNAPVTVPHGLQLPGGTLNTGAMPLERTQTQQRTMTHTLPPEEPEEQDRTGGRLLLIMGLVFVAILGGAGWFAWQEGLIGTPAGPAVSPPGVQASAGGIPEPVTATREGFLAAFDTGTCSYVSRVTGGENAGMLEGIAADDARFDAVRQAYAEQFGSGADILQREIEEAQCPALDFARALQGRGRSGVEMFVTPDRVASRAPVTAQLTVPLGQAVWLILISPKGGIYNLTDRMSQPVGDQRNVTFGLNLSADVDEAPQLVLAVESDTPLAAAATARNGDQAAALLPLVLDEIEKRDGAASAALSWVLLTHEPPAASDN